MYQYSSKTLKPEDMEGRKRKGEGGHRRTQSSIGCDFTQTPIKKHTSPIIQSNNITKILQKEQDNQSTTEFKEVIVDILDDIQDDRPDGFFRFQPQNVTRKRLLKGQAVKVPQRKDIGEKYQLNDFLKDNPIIRETEEEINCRDSADVIPTLQQKPKRRKNSKKRKFVYKKPASTKRGKHHKIGSFELKSLFRKREGEEVPVSVHDLKRSYHKSRAVRKNPSFQKLKQKLQETNKRNLYKLSLKDIKNKSMYQNIKSRKKTPVLKMSTNPTKTLNNHFTNYLKKKIPQKAKPMEKEAPSTHRITPQVSQVTISRDEYLILLQSIQKLTQQMGSIRKDNKEFKLQISELQKSNKTQEKVTQSQQLEIKSLKKELVSMKASHKQQLNSDYMAQICQRTAQDTLGMDGNSQQRRMGKKKVNNRYRKEKYDFDEDDVLFNEDSDCENNENQEMNIDKTAFRKLFKQN